MSETAWLIEHPRLPLWWGTDCGGDWVGASKALRFARKTDAEALARFLKLDGARATEHMWSDPVKPTNEWDVLNERELTALEQSSGDDCDMAAVKCAVRELRARRAADLLDHERMALTMMRHDLGTSDHFDRHEWFNVAMDVLDKLLASGGGK